jgi:phosphatidylinositol glycan class Q protein
MREQWHLPQHTVLHAVAVGGTVTLTVLDLLAGAAVALYIAHQASLGVQTPLLALMHSAGQLLHVEVLKANIVWLSAVPAGLKLNEPLTAHLSSLVMYLLSLWNSLTTVLTPLEPAIATGVALSGLLGLSLLLAVLADILHAITTHVFLLYYVFAALWRNMLSVAVSLFYLFRNKKNNVLRSRVDTAQSDVAQLLQGVLLFSLVLLLPTVGVYYSFFTVVWGGILAVQAVIWMSIAVLTRFPFYGLGVRALRPGCMPGGVRVRMCLPDGADLRVLSSFNGRPGASSRSVRDSPRTSSADILAYNDAV